MPYSNVTPEALREAILHLIRTDDEVKQAIDPDAPALVR